MGWLFTKTTYEAEVARQNAEMAVEARRDRVCVKDCEYEVTPIKDGEIFWERGYSDSMPSWEELNRDVADYARQGVERVEVGRMYYVATPGGVTSTAPYDNWAFTVWTADKSGLGRLW